MVLRARGRTAAENRHRRRGVPAPRRHARTSRERSRDKSTLSLTKRRPSPATAISPGFCRSRMRCGKTVSVPFASRRIDTGVRSAGPILWSARRPPAEIPRRMPSPSIRKWRDGAVHFGERDGRRGSCRCHGEAAGRKHDASVCYYPPGFSPVGDDNAFYATLLLKQFLNFGLPVKIDAGVED